MNYKKNIKVNFSIFVWTAQDYFYIAYDPGGEDELFRSCI